MTLMGASEFTSETKGWGGAKHLFLKSLYKNDKT